MNFGDQLQTIRKQKGFTLCAFCERYNAAYHSKMTPSTLSRYEHERQQPSAQTVRRIAKILNVPPAVLLDQEESPTEVDEILRRTGNLLRQAPCLTLDGEVLTPEQVDKILFTMELATEALRRETKIV